MEKIKYERGKHPNSRNGFKKGYKSNKKGRTYEEIFGEEKANTKRKKHSNKMKGWKQTKEHVEKRTKPLRGRKREYTSEETCRKIAESHRGAKSHFWQGGKNCELYPEYFTKQLKRKIRKRDNFICQSCGKRGWCVHHIDYNKNNCDENNLITLCVSCHMKTNFKREDWTRYFQEKLRCFIQNIR